MDEREASPYGIGYYSVVNGRIYKDGQLWQQVLRGDPEAVKKQQELEKKGDVRDMPRGNLYRFDPNSLFV